MWELIQFDRLYEDDSLRSPSGRYVLRYDGEGVAVITDTVEERITWRAGEPERPAAGLLVLGDRGEIQVEPPKDAGPGWRSGIAAPGARSMVLTDAGELELLSGEGVRVHNSRTGPVEARALHEAAPAADITADSFLLQDGRKRRTVTREPDGSLRVGEHTANGAGMSYVQSGPLVDWLEQDGTVLTWRLLPVNGTKVKARLLCLTDADGTVLWAEGRRGPTVELPPGEPNAYGGPELGAGGRLRHQSLTSASGSHTLVHQEDGNLVLYCNAAHRAVWATGTWWVQGGWAELSADGDLVVRNPYGAAVWSSGTAGSGARRLVVRDDGGVALLDADGTPLWTVEEHTPCTEPGMNTARGAVLRRGQTLQRQSLTSTDGSTVLAHRDDQRLVLSGKDGDWIWNAHIAKAKRSTLALEDDGMLRVRAEDGAVALELGGPADELEIVPGEARLCRADGTVVWRNGAAVTGPEPEQAQPEEDFEAWIEELSGSSAYCVTVVHDTEPDEVLRRLGADPSRIETGTWADLLTQGEIEETDIDDVLVAAFALGPHTLLVEENGWAGHNTPALSLGTFAVSNYRSINADTTFVVCRDGEVVADHSEEGSAEPTTPEVLAALEAMGWDDPLEAAFEDGLELLCRTAGVLPTVADVTGPARWTIISER